MENIEIVKSALAEHGTVIQGFAGDLAETQKSVGELQAQLVDLAQQQTSGYGFMDAGRKQSVFESLVKSSEIEALRSGATKSALVPLAASLPELRKSIVGDAGTVTDDPLSIQAQRGAGFFNDPRRSISLLDLLPRVQVASNAFEFVRLDSFVNAADFQLTEGSAKAEQAMPTEVASAPIATIAVTLPASEQVLADSPQLSQFLSGRLTFSVLEKLEREIISGTAGTGRIGGLLGQATLFTQSVAAASADALGEALAQLETLGWQGGLIVLNPADWQTIRSERATGGEYVSSGWAAPAAPSIWSVPVLTSAAMPVGEALVFDPSQCALLDRMSPRFEVGRVDAQFSQNLLTMRAELRAGLAVFAPGAVLKLAL